MQEASCNFTTALKDRMETLSPQQAAYILLLIKGISEP